jgi:hypothetical protein
MHRVRGRASNSPARPARSLEDLFCKKQVKKHQAKKHQAKKHQAKKYQAKKH